MREPSPESAIAELTGRSTTAERIAALHFFVERWFGDGHETGSLPVMPTPLAALHRLVRANPKIMAQNSLVPSTPDYVDYHDREWGFPVADDRRLFEKLCIEEFQSGLSWLTILRKREAFRAAFEIGKSYAVRMTRGKTVLARCELLLRER